jgi:acetyl esterase/lipase
VYFHGGGWVLGDVGADDPFCRALGAHTGSIVISCDYRHAPETRFPGAFDDAVAAVRWATQISESLGGNGRLAVAGWSAGGQLAASVSAAMMDDSSVTIDAQLLITPVTDALASGGSLDANAEGFFLTASVMRWFFDQYVDVADRADVRVSPLRAQDVTGLPPTVVVTAEFDPLCDQGNDYAARLVDAGVPVHHVAGRGQVHTGFHAVDLLISPAPYRMAAFDAFAALMTAPATVG